METRDKEGETRARLGPDATAQCDGCDTVGRRLQGKEACRLRARRATSGVVRWGDWSGGKGTQSKRERVKHVGSFCRASERKKRAFGASRPI